MIDKNALGIIAKDELGDFDALDSSVERSILPWIESYKGKAALVVKGVRRCGKSTLLKQVMATKFKDEGKVIQVCYELSDANTARELKGLTAALKHTKSQVGLILTFNQELGLKAGAKKVTVMPAWQWLLENEPVKVQ